MIPRDPLQNVLRQKKCLRRWLLQARHAHFWRPVFGLRYSLRRVDRYQHRLLRRAERQAVDRQQHRQCADAMKNVLPGQRRERGCLYDPF